MIGVALGIISYLIAATGTFGGDLVYALGVAEIWYWFVLFAISLVALVALAVLVDQCSTMGADTAGKVGRLVGMAIGGVLGVFVSILLFAKVIIILMMLNWLTGNIDVAAENFDDLTSKQVIALAATLIVVLFPFPPKTKGSEG